jgi:hypothetical protein
VHNVLSHIFGEAHADGESDKLIASVMKQAASQHHKWSQPKAQDVPAVDPHKMLSQRQGWDKASVMINRMEYIAKVHDVMYQVSNHKQTTLPLALIDRGANGYITKVHDVMYQVSNHKQTTLPLALIDRGTNSGVAGSDT